VEIGDEVPYIARHHAAGSLGIEWDRYTADLRASYMGPRRISAGQGDIPDGQKLDAHVAVDLAGETRIDGRTSVFATVRNVFDEVYVASRLPAGLRPGLPRTFILGMRTTF
jgi:Fe(3+) dicitrate transport protein